MVQLKHYDSKIYGYKAEEFQFHNGTIKTPCAFLSFHISCKFQFHNGTIKTSHLMRDVLDEYNFNSIMVQLKLAMKTISSILI